MARTPTFSDLGAEWVVNMDVADEHLNASGEVYAIYIDDAWDFKAAGVLDGDCLRQTVDKIDPAHPLSESGLQGRVRLWHCLLGRRFR